MNQQKLADLHSHQSRLDRAMAALEGPAPRRGPGRPPKNSSSATKCPTMSLAAWRLIGAAKKVWWAKQKGQSAAKKAEGPQLAIASAPAVPISMRRRSASGKCRPPPFQALAGTGGTDRS